MKLEAKLMFAYYTGELNLRVNRRREAEQKFGGVACLVGVCCGDDSLDHIKVCPGYQTKPREGRADLDEGKYLLDLHLERVRRWRSPLVWTGYL